MERDAWGGWTTVRGAATGFFRTEQIGGRWWLVTPGGHAFVSLGVNHLDPAALLHTENQDLWFGRYGGERERWIREGVVRDLVAWGFNTVGWTQEVVTPEERRHSPSWTPADYRAAKMPYCHLLPFARIARYDPHPVYDDVESEEFAVWCDFLARSVCVELRDDPYLVGYFYGDVPGWAGHAHTDASWAGRGEDLGRIARRYYGTIGDAIRRYDTNHLLLGDRYYGPQPIPQTVLLAAAENGVDVISVESFERWPRMAEILGHCHRLTGKPVLLADGAYNPPRAEWPDEEARQRERGRLYAQTLTQALREPWFVGFHWCAYLTNRVRGNGLKTERDEPHTPLTSVMTDLHRRVYALAAAMTGE